MLLDCFASELVRNVAGFMHSLRLERHCQLYLDPNQFKRTMYVLPSGRDAEVQLEPEIQAHWHRSGAA